MDLCQFLPLSPFVLRSQQWTTSSAYSLPAACPGLASCNATHHAEGHRSDATVDRPAISLLVSRTRMIQYAALHSEERANNVAMPASHHGWKTAYWDKHGTCSEGLPITRSISAILQASYLTPPAALQAMEI